MANISGCNISSTRKIAECIKRWPTEEVIALSKEVSNLEIIILKRRNKKRVFVNEKVLINMSLCVAEDFFAVCSDSR